MNTALWPWRRLAVATRGGASVFGADDEQPLRAELFGIDQLDRHAKSLAGEHEIGPSKGPDLLLPRLAENERVLHRAYELVAGVAERNGPITPASEWLLDNFYLIEEQIRIAKRDLPKGYSRQLPRLLNPSVAGFPRVYVLALELISHVDSAVNDESLAGFITAHQTVAKLMLGELWAIPIMLRLALIENLRRVAASLATETMDRSSANLWADRIVATAEKEPSSLIITVADMARANPPMSGAFVAEFARRLRGQNPSLAFPLNWIEQRLSDSGSDIEHLVQADSQKQAADQVTVGNSIGSLRFIGCKNWREFVESTSIVEQILRDDPPKVYGMMDFATRDQYRHVVERVARRGRLGEEAVALQAVALARQAVRKGENPIGADREAHVGHYLIDRGLPRLERALRAGFSIRSAVRMMGRRVPLLFYLGGILLLTGLVTWGAISIGLPRNARPAPFTVIVILSAIGASHLAVALVNWLATLIIKPHPLPKLDFSRGIPPDRRTLVVIPTMLGSLKECRDLLEGLEVRYLANRDENLWFALLTDFGDAPKELLPGDGDLIDHARIGIEKLNAKHGSNAPGPFLLMHRPRRWNSQEGVWMGWERKRGKLADLNALLRGRGKERFSVLEGDVSILGSIKYVITLDTDTQLPRDAARQLVGAISHPLNKAKYDPRKRRVCEGYAILQPRVAVSLPGTSRSWYVRLFAGEAGIDPYTRTISDVYQDVFCEGSYIGKGIYDVDAFDQALHDCLPENRILSHDLLEGCHARSALVSDIQLYEDFPSVYSSDVSRRHRWIRGDWQIFPWLLPRVPGATARLQANPISALSRWKILDNLRRSLVPGTLTVLLLLGWTTMGPGWIWSAFVIGIIFLPPALESVVDALCKPADIPFAVHLSTVGGSVARRLGQGAITLFFLPYDAYYSLDAIIRTGLRMVLTRRKLLEWKTARDTENGARTDLASFFRTMWIAPVLAVASSGCMFVMGTGDYFLAMPLLALWLISPAVAWWLSRPIPPAKTKLHPGQVILLRKLTRKTWRFFETFVGEEDHWLPPDNYQEFPVEAVAHRTSPTNIGLSLLATLAAHDFGYISADEMMRRLSRALETMGQLERFRGHFYNWYDTRTLKPLRPMYVSSVDSGNLTGYLMTLRPGLLETADKKILTERAFAGLHDTLLVLSDVVRETHRKDSPSQNGRENAETLARRIEQMKDKLQAAPTTLAASGKLLQQLAGTAGQLILNPGDRANEELHWWLRAFEAQCRNLLDDAAFLAPWIALPDLMESVGGRCSSGHPEPDARTREVWCRLETIPTPREVARLESDLLPVIDAILDGGDAAASKTNGSSPSEETNRLIQLRPMIVEASLRAAVRISTLEQLARDCGGLSECDYNFLYDENRKLMAIGFNATEHRRDAGHYDLLASEARVCSFIAIAQGQLPQEHWFALGRLLTESRGRPALLSWGGSMFEYLMPLLIMPNCENTLLDETCRAAVERQIKYGTQRGVPWGMSESGYNVTDASLNYQYRAFGVPGLGLKRGLADDLVVSPYATVMALMIRPGAGCKNLERLAREGAEGRYGYYEAVDYTAARLSPGERREIVQSFMAHHQGMSLLSLASVLLDRPMQRRFGSDPVFQATELLLQERIPRAAPIFPHAAEVSGAHRTSEEAQAVVRVYTDPNTPSPEVHLLSNGRYSVMVTNSGGGYSRWQDVALTRWNEDATRDHSGMFCYLRDAATGQFWSATHQPTLKSAKNFEALFPPSRAEFKCLKSDIDTRTEIAVSPEDDIELRRVSVTNRSDHARTIELTTYAEVAITTPAAMESHPAFSKLFVETEIIRPLQAILCTRRPRSKEEHPPFMFHLMSAGGDVATEPSYETDRLSFVGRGRTPADPAAMSAMGDLSGSEGAVLDPIVAIRRRLTIAPGATVVVDIVTGASETRDGARALIEKYHDGALGNRVFGLAWTHGQVLLRQLNASDADAQAYERLAGSVIFPSLLRRAHPGVLILNRGQQSALWAHGISGDLPIIVVRISDSSKIELVRQLIQAHAYWRLKGLPVDLLILNEDHTGYRQLLHDEIMGLIASGAEAGTLDHAGGIFVRRHDQIPEETRILIETAARAIFVDSAGTLAEQVDRRNRTGAALPAFIPMERRGRREPPLRLSPPRHSPPRPDRSDNIRDTDSLRRELICHNGLGGFTRDGREYVIRLTPGMTTPMPWANVLANPSFGTVVSESGGGYTWSENAHEFRLTPWHNDPVSDTSGEAIYIRDEETGRFWSPTPLPARGETPYTTRHGFGYSVFEHTENGVTSELWVYVATDAPVKFSVLKIRNHSGQWRRLSATGFVEWTLGQTRSKSAMHVTTGIDPKCGALFARNFYNNEFSDRVAFFDLNEPSRTFTGDRAEFLGRNGRHGNPAAMSRARLSGKVGAGFDPCAAMQVRFDLSDGQERECVFTLGAARDADEARSLVLRFRGAGPARQALESVWEFWKRSLGAVHLETPDPSINVLANGWLLYQAWACRLWGRSGYYQSGGAYGFRDQLQDSLALLHSAPWLIREHLLRCAARQFIEGDVAHWWHPPADRGVRTRFSDDYLWMPWVTAHYVAGIGDTGVLDERINFIEGRALKPEEESYYDLPNRSEEAATLYDHCVRAIQHALRFGPHGLPLMGGGDWNDGMNLVGEKGRGESVWLAFFLYDVLTRFAEVAGRRGDAAFSERCKIEAAQLRENIENGGWDGEWYRRAYFDDGEPLGSSGNAECRIDSIPQSWAVLSGAGDGQRARAAMQSVDRLLIHRDTRIAQLFDPPFDKSLMNPGYIGGYPPGVRENGGQYTHAAIWAAMAFAELGDKERMWNLFQMINPVNLGGTAERIKTYKVEPYVVAADVYSKPPHTGRGGWTWYTGSAAWMYRLITESIVGLRLEVDRLSFSPRLPADWKSFMLHYRYRETFHHIHFTQGGTGMKVTRVMVDGIEQPDRTIPLKDDRNEHHAEVVIE